jgi:flavin reductase (DIM6/NTAB) family NADH-FMN oxidoreductase RutF
METTTAQDLGLQFRAAMRQLASTVTVITARHADEHHGMAATAVTSVSMDPPSLLVCVNRGATMHAALGQSALFCINLLGVQHGPLCDAFGGKLVGSARFGVGDWASDEDGVRYLTDAPANIFCRLEQQHNYGSHTIFIGRVERVRVIEEGQPLLYRAGGIGSFSPL